MEGRRTRRRGGKRDVGAVTQRTVINLRPLRNRRGGIKNIFRAVRTNRPSSMAATDLAAESRQVAADHSFLLPTVSSCEAAAATYGSIPVLILPIYFIPIGIVILLLLYTLVLIGKGVSGRITTTGSRIAEAMFMYGSWPRGMDDGELAADAMAERELVCTAIELLDSDDQRVPDVFRCPIGLNIMRDPVMTSDGHAYEREQAKEFLSRCGPSSPLTKQRMAAR